MTFSTTDRIDSAHSANVARTLTLAIDAGLIKGAVAVHSATSNTLLFQADPLQTTVII